MHIDQHIKTIIGSALALAALLGGYAAVSYAMSYGKSIQPSSFRSFTVSAQGKATAVPDIAEFSFQVVTQGGTDVASLQAKNTNNVNKAIAFVKSEGVADSDIATQYYNIDPRYQTYDCRTSPVSASVSSVPSVASAAAACPPPDIVGYTVTQSVDVKVRDFSKIGPIMNGIVANGANQVGALSFTIDDPTKVQDAARADAIAKAKEQADAIAQAGGFKIGRLLSVQQGSGVYAPMAYDAAGIGMKAALSSAAPSPVIQPGSQEVDATVSLQYEIE